MLERKKSEAYYLITLSSYPRYMWSTISAMCLSEIVALIHVRWRERLGQRASSIYLFFSFLFFSWFALFIMITSNTNITKRERTNQLRHSEMRNDGLLVWFIPINLKVNRLLSNRSMVCCILGSYSSNYRTHMCDCCFCCCYFS